MTIVDSINGVTSALGGDPKDANTIQEAIDTLTPVIVEKTSGGGGGGGISFGTATIVATDISSIGEVALEGLTTFDDYISQYTQDGNFSEPALITYYVPDEEYGQPIRSTSIGIHAFCNYDGNKSIEELRFTVTFNVGEVQPGVPALYIPPDIIAYRVYANSEWGDWVPYYGD